MNRSYQTDLTDAEWVVLEPHVAAPKKRGRPRTHSPPEILNAVFYVLKSGCPWRLLPRDFPPWETVYWWFARWSKDGTFERLNALSCASVYGPAWAGKRYLARASPIRKRPRVPGSAGSRGALIRQQEDQGQEAPLLVDTEGLVRLTKPAGG